jgi:hypothetical protein
MSSRTVLVIGDDPELAVGLRDRLDRGFVTVREVRESEALDAVRDCAPWPWMVVGGGALPGEVTAWLARRPVLVFWLSGPPPGLPAHTRRVAGFSDLVATVERALGARLAGMSLALDGGVTMPGGAHAAGAALEALIAAYPGQLDAPISLFHQAARTLAAHRLPLRPAQLPGGGVVLAAVEDG